MKHTEKEIMDMDINDLRKHTDILINKTDELVTNTSGLVEHLIKENKELGEKNKELELKRGFDKKAIESLIEGIKEYQKERIELISLIQKMKNDSHIKKLQVENKKLKKRLNYLIDNIKLDS